MPAVSERSRWNNSTDNSPQTASSRPGERIVQLPIKLDRCGNHTLQSQLFDGIRKLILSGQLRPGTTLPSSRALSEQLSVSRNTVIVVYERLIAEDYLHTHPTVGTFVNADLPHDSVVPTGTASQTQASAAHQRQRHRILFQGRAQAVVNSNRHELDVDFWVGRPDPHSFPTKAWRRLMLRNLSAAGSNLTEYRDPTGIFGLRKAIAEHLGPARGIAATPEQVIVVNGSQEALNVIARLLVKDGTPVVTECPAYQGAAFLFESYGAELNPVPVDGDGLDVSRLPRKRVGMAYVTPSHQYPLGATLALARRMRLLDWARENGAFIVEDDYDSDFRHRGSPLIAMAGLDRHGCVIYMGTFSKSTGAGIRLGYLVVPAELAQPAGTVKALLDNGHTWLDQAVLADFIASGSYAKHLRRIRHAYLLRRDCLVAALRAHFGEPCLGGLDGGMHLVWHLPPDLPTAAEVQDVGQQVGVGVYGLEGGAAYTFGCGGCCERVLMLGYSSVPEPKIREGIARLAAGLAAVGARRAPRARAADPGRADRSHGGAANGGCPCRGIDTSDPPPRPP